MTIKNDKTVALNDEVLSKVSGGCNEVSSIFGEVNTCQLCGNDEPGKVYPISDLNSGLRIIQYYCEKCKETFGVYVG